MSKIKNPNIEYLRECFRYEGGKLFWLERPLGHFRNHKGFNSWNARFPGKEAGSIANEEGKPPRCYVGIGQRLHFRARIVWAFHHNEWPERIDHKNRNTLDDSIGNLRPCSRSQNGQNVELRKKSTDLPKGVSFHKHTGKFQSRIRLSTGSLYLGIFDDPQDAHAAYVKAAMQHFGEFACTG